MQRKKNKKGFTIVELVIVIAVIAILAGVLIPTFVSVTKKANESADIQAVRQMNTVLAIDGVVEPTTLVGLYEVLEEAGMDAENYTPLYKDRYFYWDKGLNMILYVDSDKSTIIFPEKVNSSGQWYILDGTFDSSNATISLPNGTPSTTTTLEISSAADFVKSAEYVKKYSSTYTSAKKANPMTIEIILANDIDLQGADINFLSDIAQGLNVVLKSDTEGTARTITGLYNSDNHTTSGYSADGELKDTYGHSMFNCINSLQVSDIIIKDSAIGGYSASQAGLFAGQIKSGATFKNVTVKNCEIQGLNKVGVLCGFTYGKVTFDNVTIENCSVTSAQGEAGVVFGVMIAGTKANGQIAGEDLVTGSVNIVNSTVEIADFATVKEIVVDDEGNTQKLVEYVEDGEYEWRVATAKYAFYAYDQSVDKTEYDGINGKGRLYTPMNTPEEFESAKTTNGYPN